MEVNASPPDSIPAAPAHQAHIIPVAYVPERAGTVSFFSSQTREGDWLLPRLFRLVSVFGNIEIDLTHARVGPGTSRIEVRALFANIEITVPPWIRVECDGSGIAANFEVDTKLQPPPEVDAPVISVGGVAMFGNVEVKVVDPNAPGWIDRIAARFRGDGHPR